MRRVARKDSTVHGWPVVDHFFFFFKRKTAYDIGTGDWSSDVCSSDLQTYDSKSFREVITKDIAEYIKGAEDTALVELYNSISDNEAVYNEESSNILIKTPETNEIIADAEQAEAPAEQETGRASCRERV